MELLIPLPPGTFELVTRAGGQAGRRVPFEVRSGQVLQLEVTLTPASP